MAKWAARPPHISIDSNGNLTSKTDGSTTWTYEWNAENQLTRVLNNGSEVARYRYDAKGRRVEKVAGGTTTTWAYDSEDILRQIRAGAVSTYVQGADTDEPLAEENSSSVLTYFHADALGSVWNTTNQAGSSVAAYSYDAFGTMSGGAAGYAYTSREWDPEPQLYYYRARYYDPTTGRFVGEDPAHDGTNWYSYVGANPVNRVDPQGLYELMGFPQGRAAEVNLAMLMMVHRLNVPPEKCCAGPYGPALLEKLADPDLVIEWDPGLTDCGVVPNVIPRSFGLMRPKIKLGPNAWSCCTNRRTGIESLAATLMHEIQHNISGGPEGVPNRLMEWCFNCLRTGIE